MLNNQSDGLEEDEAGHRIRLRFRVAKPLNTDELERTIEAAGRAVTLLSQVEGQPIKEASWLILRARGFTTEHAARTFGDRLKLAVVFSSLCCRLGVDVGYDLPTSSPGLPLVERMRQAGIELRANVHGLDVFPDRENTRVFVVSGTGIIRSAIEPFLGQVKIAVQTLPGELPKTRHAVLLLNAALMNPEPLAQLVLAISAVEMLGQSETWSQDQRRFLKRLASKVEIDQELSLGERLEVAEAIRRGIHRLGLRQGVLRVLDALGLSHLRSAWDTVYGERSNIFHGTSKMKPTVHAQLAHEAISLCGRIVLSSAATEGAELPGGVEGNYPAP